MPPLRPPTTAHEATPGQDETLRISFHHVADPVGMRLRADKDKEGKRRHGPRIAVVASAMVILLDWRLHRLRQR